MLPFLVGTAYAAMLDPTFGTGGKVHGPATFANERAVGVVVDPGTGRIFLVTVSGKLYAHLSDGSLDGSFGTGGVVTAVSGARELTTLVRQPADGKLVVVGFDKVGGSPVGTVVRRYDASGTLDTAFGTAGEATTSQPDLPRAAVVQPDDTIVVGGPSGISTTPAALARFLPDGTLDPGFGTGGVVVTGTTSGPGSMFPLALLPDGDKVVVGGGNGDYVLARYESDGSLDTSFGTDGFVSTPVTPSYLGFIRALVRQTDGKIVAAGASFPPTVRYSADGVLDPSYASADEEGFHNIFSSVDSAVLDGDGVVVSSGIVLFRVTAAGRLDTSFAPCAYNIPSFVTSALARQPDGKLIVAGSLQLLNPYEMHRYAPGSPACQPSAPGASRLKSRPREGDSPTVKWSWTSSAPVPLTDFGNPLDPYGDGYVACLLQPAEPFFGGIFVRPNRSEPCELAPSCWRSTSSSYRISVVAPTNYRQERLKIQLRSSNGTRPGKIKLSASRAASGAIADTPYTTPATMRLDRNGSPFCWDAQFSAPTKNDASGFSSRSQ